MKFMKKIISLMVIVCLIISIVQVPIDSEAASNNEYTVYGEAVERAEDVFHYLDDFYTDQHPDAALRSRLFHPSDSAFVKDLAELIVSGCTTDKQKADAVARWIASNITYDAGASAHVMDALYEEKGNCVSYAMLMEELLHQVGVPAIVGTGWRGNFVDMTKMDKDMFNEYGHAWCFVYLDDQWVLYDVLFNEYGISNLDYIAKWYYLRNVDWVVPVYDEAYAPVGFQRFAAPDDYNDMIYYYVDRIANVDKSGKIASNNTGRVYTWQNNYLVTHSINTDEEDSWDGTFIEARPEEDAQMQRGEVYVDGWLVNANGNVFAYCYENGSQPAYMVTTYKGEQWMFLTGGSSKLLLSTDQFRFQEGLLTVETGYRGEPIEVLSQEEAAFAEISDIRTSDSKVIAVENGQLVAKKPGYATIEWDVKIKNDTGYLRGVQHTIKVVDQFNQYSLDKYKKPGEDAVTRVYGATRYKTAYGISDILKEATSVSKYDSVIIANGANFPDALAGSYLAAKKKAPILMSDGDLYSANTAELLDYIDRNIDRENISVGQADKVDIYILGGDAAVPNELQEELQNRGYNVKRLSGKGRYDTNLAILEEAGVTDEEILVCTGTNFADSLSASAAGLPILLLDPKATKLTDKQKEFLTNANNDITIIGGEAAVNKTMENILSEYDEDGKAERVKGANRYETSVAVAKKIFGDEAPKTAVIAYSQNFPDGLAGGPLAYFMKAPLILTGPLMKNGKPVTSENTATTVAKSYMKEYNITQGIVLGGSGALSQNSVLNVFGLSDQNEIFDDKYKAPSY